MATLELRLQQLNNEAAHANKKISESRITQPHDNRNDLEERNNLAPASGKQSESQQNQVPNILVTSPNPEHFEVPQANCDSGFLPISTYTAGVSSRSPSTGSAFSNQFQVYFVSDCNN